ncbi:hypothetical protein QW131_31985 [Roseibium salinum]|nr:hypothetical protein [Roseibium salinum]
MSRPIRSRRKGTNSRPARKSNSRHSGSRRKTYFIIRVDDDTFKLAATKDDALNDVAIDFVHPSTDSVLIAVAGDTDNSFGLVTLSPAETPLVTATVGSGSDLTAGENIEIGTVLSNTAQPYDPSIAEVNTNTDTIRLNQQTGLSTGDAVSFKEVEGLIGVDTARNYNVISTGNDTLQLGKSFNTGFVDIRAQEQAIIDAELTGGTAGSTAGIDPVLDLIDFGGDHGFQTGDKVRFIGETGQTKSFTLLRPEIAELAFSASDIDVDAETITITGHGLETGKLVRFTPDGSTESDFYTIWIDANTIALAASRIDAWNGTRVGFEVAVLGEDAVRVEGTKGDGATAFQLVHVVQYIADTVFEIANHGLETGDQISWRLAEDGAPRQLLYVGKVDDNHISLYNTREAAETGDSSELVTLDIERTFELSTPEPQRVTVAASAFDINSETITIFDPGLQTGQKVLFEADGGPVTTLFVIRVGDNTIALASSVENAEKRCQDWFPSPACAGWDRRQCRQLPDQD